MRIGNLRNRITCIHQHSDQFIDMIVEFDMFTQALAHIKILPLKMLSDCRVFLLRHVFRLFAQAFVWIFFFQLKKTLRQFERVRYRHFSLLLAAIGDDFSSKMLRVDTKGKLNWIVFKFVVKNKSGNQKNRKVCWRFDVRADFHGRHSVIANAMYWKLREKEKRIIDSHVDRIMAINKD